MNGSPSIADAAATVGESLTPPISITDSDRSGRNYASPPYLELSTSQLLKFSSDLRVVGHPSSIGSNQGNHAGCGIPPNFCYSLTYNSSLAFHVLKPAFSGFDCFFFCRIPFTSRFRLSSRFVER